MAAPKEKTTICEAAVIGLAYSADLKQVAFSPNNHTVCIASCGAPGTDCVKWAITTTLEQHGQSVTAVDWHPKTGKILSVAQDRTGFVWELVAKSNEWVPSMLMLESAMKRGLTCCAWSCDGDRAYVGSAACNIAIGMWDAENSWWWCKAFKDLHASTVTTLAAHPRRNRLIATGSTDCRVSVIDAAIKPVDGCAPSIIKDFFFKGWVNAISWSPEGSSLVVATHDSSISVITDPSLAFGDGIVAQRVLLSCLPFRAAQFLNETTIVAAGHDFYPMCFTSSAGKWALSGRFAGEGKQKKELSETEKARLKFQNTAATGQAEAVQLAKSKHKNTIVSIARLAPGGGAVATTNAEALVFATGSMDGRVEVWAMKEMSDAN